MTIILMLLKSYWKHIIIVVLLMSVAVYGYKKVYSIGYNAHQVECKLLLSEYESKMLTYKKVLDERIKSLEETSIQLVKETSTEKAAIRKDFAKIITIYKDKPLIVIEKETCVPSATFIEAYNEAVKRVNQ